MPSSYKIRAVGLLLGILVNSLFDLIGIAAVLPLIATILKEDFIHSNAFLSWIYVKGGFTSDNSFIAFLSAVIFLTIVVKNLFGLWIQKTQYQFTFDAFRVVSNQVLQSAYNKGFTFFKNNNSNEILNEVSYIPHAFSKLLLTKLFQFLNEFVIMGFVVIGLIVYDPKIIGLLIVILVPFFYSFYSLSKSRVSFYSKRLADLNALISKPVYELIFGYTDVRIGGVFESFRGRYDKGIKEKSQVSIKNQVLQQIPNRMVEIIVLMALLIMLLYGVFVLRDHEKLLTMLSVFGLASFRAVPSFNRLMLSYMDIKGQQFALSSLDRYLPFHSLNINQTDLIYNSSITIKDLAFQFEDGVQLFEGFNQIIKKGEVVGVVGKSGSGKTTLMNLLLGFLKPTSGAIYIDGVELNNELIESWHHKIGYVSQDVFILDGTVADNVAIGIDKHQVNNDQLNAVLNKARLTEVVNELVDGVNTNIGERGTKLSGGQRQRIGIARALYHGAEVLFFDEATSALDNETESEITEAIQSLNTGELTMIIIAHRESTFKYCDRLINM